ncbi:Splicing factor 1 [Cichlidogyrus casuarinus]|uniref:Branchpoint-bridging protein n=1 Tax=Cichlidogyrus casuarinus TaxID=1844966 RepID=A0ABD2PTH1_9PLAT
MSKRSHEGDSLSFPNNFLESREERRARKRKSRWQETDKSFVPGMPTQIPSNLTPEQEKMYIIQLQIEDYTRRLRTGDLGIPAKPEDRSPSPEPVYDQTGKRLNTREYRTRKRMEEDRHALIQRLTEMNPDYKPPADYRAPSARLTDKVWIPQDNHPNINFVGLLIGPRGNTLKALEKETNAKIIIRGKGSVKDGKIGRLDGMPLPGEDEPLHAYVQAATPEALKFACDRIQQIIKEGIEVPEGENDLRKAQLRELALLNGTLRENEGLAKLRAIAESQTIATNTIMCSHCGGAGHLDKDCRVNTAHQGGTYYSLGAISQVITNNPQEKAKMDSEYTALMAELGVNGMPKGSGPPGTDPLPPGVKSSVINRQPPPPGLGDDEPPPGVEPVSKAGHHPNRASVQPSAASWDTHHQTGWGQPPANYYPPPPPGGGFSYPTGGEGYYYGAQASAYYGGYWPGQTTGSSTVPPGTATTAATGYQLPPPPPPPPGL